MKIVKIFPTIEGESTWSGKSVTFIRFGLCNLSCIWCDTCFDKFTEMTLDQVVFEVLKYPAKHIVISGGEPTIHLDELYPLCDTLHALGFQIAIQTNGTNKFDINYFDHIVLSPKEEVEMAKESQNKNREVKHFICNDLKLVDKGWTLEQYDQYASKFKILSDKWLQPLSNEKESIDQCLKLVMSGEQWRFSLQMHKVIGAE